MHQKKENLRVLPSFVMDAIFMWTGLVLGILPSHFKHFGVIKKFTVEAERLLVLLIHGLAFASLRSHVDDADLKCDVEKNFKKSEVCRIEKNVSTLMSNQRQNQRR